jgi:hypothetical protein
MKKMLLYVLLSLGLLTSSNATFMQVGLGYSMGDNVDNVTFLGTVNVISEFGVRLEYTKNITDDVAFTKKDVTRYGLFATYTLPLIGGLSVTPKAGLVKTDGSFEITDVIDSISGTTTDFSYGLEVNYDINRNISAFIGYTDYSGVLNIQSVNKGDLDKNNVTFGVKISL